MTFTENILDKAYTYSEYKNLVLQLYEAGKSTGPIQSEAYLNYTKLNIQRTKRVEKTTILAADLVSQLHQLKNDQLWLVLTEGWCGDAAQQVPVFNLIATQFPKVQLKLLLRDENLDIMDQFLTNGTRSIPKLLIIDSYSKQLLASWGPQPQEVIDLLNDLKKQGLDSGLRKEKLHLWYAQNNSKALMNELTQILQKINQL